MARTELRPSWAHLALQLAYVVGPGSPLPITFSSRESQSLILEDTYPVLALVHYREARWGIAFAAGQNQDRVRCPRNVHAKQE